MKPTLEMQELADRLQGTRLREAVGAKDVLVYYTGRDYYGGEPEIVVVFKGPALRMKRYALAEGLRNPDATLDLDMQRALGMPAASRRIGREVFADRQFFPSRSAHIADIVEGVQSASNAFLGIDEGVEMTLMPEEGEPWSEQNSPTPYYSAKTRRVKRTKKPPWIMPVEYMGTSGEVKTLGADFCAVAPVVEACGSGPIVGAVRGPRSPWFTVTHSLEIVDRGGKTTMASARAIRKCGGLLFPSLAVGLVPATNFGPVVLVADLEVILPSLRPYKKKRGQWPIAIYDTDAWTGVTAHFMGEGARELREELTASPDTDWLYRDDFWVLGPPLRADRAELVPSTKKLRTTLAKRARIYKRELSLQQLEDVRTQHLYEAAKYAYVEAKSNGIMSMDCFPVAVCPKEQKSKVQRWLKAAGFRGKILTLDVPTPEDRYYSLKDRDPDTRDAQWDYGWAVMDALMDYAEKTGRMAVLDE